MCILESTTIVNIQQAERLPLIFQEKSIIQYKSKYEVIIPKIFSERSLNPLPFLEDIKQLTSELQIIIEDKELAKIISIYMARENACSLALKNMKLLRKDYLKICIIIKRRLKIYNNYLIDTLINKRMQGWLDRHEKEITKAFENLTNNNIFIESEYLEHVNSVTNEKMSKFYRMKKNKVPLCKIGHEKFYVSKYLMTSLGAVKWYRKTKSGIIKQKLLDELKMMSIKGYFPSINDFIVYDNNPAAIFIESIYDESQKIVKKQEIELERLDKFFSYRSYLVKTLQNVKSDNIRIKNLNKFKQDYGKVKFTGVKKIASYSVDKYLIFKTGKDVKLTTDNKKLFSHLISAPCQNKYYLFWIAWEHHYAQSGEFESKLAAHMRKERLKLAEIKYYPGFIQLPFKVIDSLMYEYRDKNPYYKLPEEVSFKNLFVINNNYYKEKSKFLGHVILQNIKSGNYVNTIQLYKNNAIESRIFVTATIMQKTIRILSKKRGIEVMSKHEILSNLKNNLAQTIPIRRFYNYNFMKFNNLIDEIYEDYKRSRTFIHQRDFFYDGRSYKEDSVRDYITKFQRGNVGTSTYRKKFKSHKNFIKKECKEFQLSEAITALDYLETHNMSLEEYRFNGEILLNSFTNLSTYSILSELEEDLDRPINLCYQTHNNPVIAIFTIRIIKMLIKFLKVYKVTKSYENREIKHASKPFRELELAILLRYRPLWDIIETNKNYVNQENEGYENWLFQKESMEKLTKNLNFDSVNEESIYEALVNFRKIKEKEEDLLVDQYGKDLTLINKVGIIKIFKYKVGKTLSVLPYLYNRKEMLEIEKSDKLDEIEVIFSDINVDKYNDYEHFEYFD